jgi:hypothetical protein
VSIAINHWWHWLLFSGLKRCNLEAALTFEDAQAREKRILEVDIGFSRSVDLRKAVALLRHLVCLPLNSSNALSDGRRADWASIAGHNITRVCTSYFPVEQVVILQ